MESGPADAGFPQKTTRSDTPRTLQLAVFPATPVAAAGDVVSLDVVVYSAERLVDAPFQLHFDPSVLRYVDAAPGDFLAQGGSSVVFFSEGSTRPGVVAVAIGRVERAIGSTGSGLLCRLRLQAVAPGSSSLVIAEPQAWDSAGGRFAVTSSGSVIDVR